MFPVGEKIPIAVVCYGFGKGLFQNYCQWCVWKGIFSFPVVVDQGLYYVQETGRCRCIPVGGFVEVCAAVLQGAVHHHALFAAQNLLVLAET